MGRAGANAATLVASEDWYPGVVNPMTGLMRGVARLLARRGARQREQASAAQELGGDDPGDARIDLVRTMTRLLAAKTESAEGTIAAAQNDERRFTSAWTLTADNVTAGQ